MRPNTVPTVAAVTWLPAGGDEERPTGRELLARCPVTGTQHINDLTGQRQSAAAVALGPHDVDVSGGQVDLIGPQGAGLAGPQPT